MSRMIDSSIWIDHFRSSTPRGVKQKTHEIISDSETVLCEPVIFELLRSAHKKERNHIEQLLSVVPVVPTPKSLWDDARKLGQICMDHGVSCLSMDLLIAQSCIANHLELVTFDEDFLNISRHCPALKVDWIKRS